MTSMLSPSLRHAFAALVAAAALTGCSSADEPQNVEPQPGAPASVTLRLNIGLVENGAAASRAEFEETSNAMETLRTLRIIIVHPDTLDPTKKIVEYNQYWDIMGGSTSTSIAATVTKEINVYAGNGIPVIGPDGTDQLGDWKDIYLIVNEHGLYSDAPDSPADADYLLGSLDLSNTTFHAGSEFNEQAFAALTFSVTPNRAVGGPIPMTEHHRVFVRQPYIQNGHIMDTDQEVSLFVTRALAKVTVSVTNAGGSPLNFTGYSLGGLSTTSYLMPCRTVYNPAKELCQTEKDFLYREITSFVQPAIRPWTLTRTFNVIAPADADPAVNRDGIQPIGVGKTIVLPSVYIPEVIAAREFPVGISINSTSLGAIPLQDTAIPRNTHLYIDVKVGDGAFSYVARMLPYREILLEPNFGLPKK